MEIACLDLEGVLIPEIWIDFAERTGIKELRATTRDIPDYDVLMQQRLRILREHNLGLPDIQDVIAGMSPLPGAAEFMDWLRQRFQIIILSDTYYEFALPLMPQLGNPTLFCHRLESDTNGMIVNYHLRQKDPKSALTAAQAAAAALPDSPDVVTALGRSQAANGEYNQAVATFNKLLSLVPQSPAPYMLMAGAQSANKDAKAAMQSLSKALELQADFLPAQLALAELAVQSGQPEQAKQPGQEQRDSPEE